LALSSYLSSSEQQDAMRSAKAWRLSGIRGAGQQMLRAVIELVRPLLYFLSPEQANRVVIKSLKAGLYVRAPVDREPCLAATVWGMHFPNPLGMAAGFDKDARVPREILSLGFGAAEVGTVTPRPQQGNPLPRVFRLRADKAVINRMGFNNGGHDAALSRLEARRPEGIVGVNVGANKDTVDRAADYVEGIRRFYDVASYLAVNVSSPNTPGLRDLQAPVALDDLLARVLAARSELMAAGRP
jgi:dihydroorotate dehydrogenase